MKFKQVEWEKRQNGYFVANVAFGLQLTVRKAFGIQLTVYKESDKWIWEIGNLAFVFKHGKSNSELMAKANAEHYFQEYVMKHIGKCTE